MLGVDGALDAGFDIHYSPATGVNRGFAAIGTAGAYRLYAVEGKATVGSVAVPGEGERDAVGGEGPDGVRERGDQGEGVVARHPDVLAAQRRERARIRGEKGIRWGGRPLVNAA